MLVTFWTSRVPCTFDTPCLRTDDGTCVVAPNMCSLIQCVRTRMGSSPRENVDKSGFAPQGPQTPQKCRVVCSQNLRVSKIASLTKGSRLTYFVLGYSITRRPIDPVEGQLARLTVECVDLWRTLFKDRDCSVLASARACSCPWKNPKEAWLQIHSYPFFFGLEVVMFAVSSKQSRWIRIKMTQVSYV